MDLIRDAGIENNRVPASWKANVKGKINPALTKKAMAFGQSVCDDI